MAESDDPVTAAKITEHFRRLIADGRLSVLDGLPSIRATAAEMQANHKTVYRAYRALVAEGLVEALPKQGFRVSAKSTLDPRLRVAISGTRQRGEAFRSDDIREITTAELRPAPPWVADAMGIEPGTPAVLRTGRVSRPVEDSPARLLRLGESWFHPRFAQLVPSLLEPRYGIGSVALIEAAIGSATEVTVDEIYADVAALWERDVFGLQIGDPILVREAYRHAGGEVIEIGRTVFPRGVRLVQEYRTPVE